MEGSFFEFGTGQSRRKDTHFVRVKVYDEITRRYMSLSQVSVLPGSSPYASKAVTGVRGKYQKRERNLCVFAKNRQYPDQVELKKSFNSRRHVLLSSVSLVVSRELTRNEASATPSTLDTKMVIRLSHV